MRKNKIFVQYPTHITFWLFEYKGWVIEAGMNICDPRNYVDGAFFINGIYDNYTYYTTFDELLSAVATMANVSERTLVNNLAFDKIGLLVDTLNRLCAKGAR